MFFDNQKKKGDWPFDCEKSNISTEENVFPDLLKRSMEPFSKRIRVIENGAMRYYAVERRGIGILKTKYGKFWQCNLP